MALPAAAAAAYRAAAQMATPAASAAIAPGQCAGRQFLRFPVRRDQGFDQHHRARANRPPPSRCRARPIIVDVVHSVNAAELTLDTVVAVRDKVVAAYQSIMNMPI